jgi:hypothetical protein
MKKTLQHAMRIWAAGLLSVIGVTTAQATHIAGTDLTYTAVPGATGMYLATLKLYRDCSGIAAPASPQIKAIPDSGAVVTLPLTLNSVTEVTDVCPGVATTCDSASSQFPGYEEYVYTGLLMLPAGSSSWTLSYSDCCRNAGILNLSGGGGSSDFYTEAFINVPAGVLNSSPTYTVNPIPFFCVNDTSTYSPQAVDADGDSLVFSLAPALGGSAPSPIPLVYGPGYSSSQPFGMLPGGIPATIDAQTGLLRFKANAVGAYVLVIKIEEYRTINGAVTKVGSCQRDVQVQVTNCSTPCPLFGNVLTSGSNTFLNSNSQVSVNPGATFQLAIPAHSTNPNVTMSMTSNCANEIPGSSFITLGAGANITGHFSWTPTSADVRTAPYYFTYHVSDNACPVPNERYGTMRVLVTNSVLATAPEVLSSEVIIPNVLSAGQSWTLPADLQGAQVNVFDATGKEVYSSASYANHFTGKNLSNGVYLFRIMPEGATSAITGQLSLEQ